MPPLSPLKHGLEWSRRWSNLLHRPMRREDLQLITTTLLLQHTMHVCLMLVCIRIHEYSHIYVWSSGANIHPWYIRIWYVVLCVFDQLNPPISGLRYSPCPVGLGVNLRLFLLVSSAKTDFLIAFYSIVSHFLLFLRNSMWFFMICNWCCIKFN